MTNTTALDLDRLQRFNNRSGLMNPEANGLYYRVEDVRALARRSQPVEAAGIKTWQERLTPSVNQYAKPMGAIECAMAEEIADLRAALAAKGQQEPVACVICGSDEPRTGTCGSDDPRALCNLAAPVAQQSEAGEEYDECPKCKGSRVLGEVRGIRCSTCNGSGIVSQPVEAGEIYRKVLAMSDGPQVIGPTEAGAPTAAAEQVAEGASLLAALFKVLTLKQKNTVLPEFAERMGRFMFDNGYRVVFNNFHLQASPTSGQESAAPEATQDERRKGGEA